jgi:hypothetical protein
MFVKRKKALENGEQWSKLRNGSLETGKVVNQLGKQTGCRSRSW